MRPNFIQRDIFRAYITPTVMNKHIRVDGILAASYISKMGKSSRPIKCYEQHGVRLWRIIDVVARANAEGHDVTPSRLVELRMDVEFLEARKSQLEKEIGVTKHRIEADILSQAISGATLLDERDIVAGMISDFQCSGVYFLIKGHRVVYVGQATNVFRRVSDHAGAKDFDGFTFISCKPESLNAIESLYIHYLKPQLNGRLPNGRGFYAPLRLDELFTAKGSNPCVSLT